ncbi:beta-glucosidase [Neobacillus niacini]|uniref:glycoside hydrolase family 3 C-terminal domain-containing protein n=1 Tax=Neobacillus niacini TaxID=86668 RepID=UPI00277EC165|nr:glycoside hydrolase family 3 C-terminal domain-containing protein [Neobacillus niacini]MDQ1003461.1 beta-glucosidase [Neobacillus niacini]
MDNKFYKIVTAGIISVFILIANGKGTAALENSISPKLVNEASIEKVIKSMTLDEKASLVIGAGYPGPNGVAGATNAILRLGIPSIILSDGPAGVRIGGLFAGAPPRYATAFPIPSLLAATWDVDKMAKVARAMGKESREYGVDILLAPGVNIHRDPLGGRNFEYYSEDPFLAGVMAASFINGVQSTGVGTSLKHFAANNQETNRTTINAIVPERALREIYLPAFEMAVKQAKPWTVMSAYNSVNGAFATQNKYLLTDILRGEWGFNGFVMSDWWAVKNPFGALAAGNDLIMPGVYKGPMPMPELIKAVYTKASAPTPDLIKAAVENGTLSESVLDTRIRNILRIVLKTPTFKGEYENVNYNKTSLTKRTADEGKRIDREAAAEGMVLLKNKDHTLPFKGVHTIGVAGQNAVVDLKRNKQGIIIGGGGSSQVNVMPEDIVSLKQGLKNANYSIVDSKNGNKMVEGLGKADAAFLAQHTDIGLVSIGRASTEGADRPDMNMKPAEVQLIKDLSLAYHKEGKKLVVVLNIGAPIEVVSWRDYADAILLAWQPGQEGGNPIADVLSGKVNPSGKLPVTFPVKYSDVPSYGNFPGDLSKNTVRYAEGIFIGYRYYDTKGIQPAYAFGHGLSYTSFTYSNLKLSSRKLNLDRNEPLIVSVDVANTGNLPGKEVVQLYIHDKNSTFPRPYKELKGFKKIYLKPGQTKTVQFTIEKRALSAFDDRLKKWVAEEGLFQVLVGSSSGNIRQKSEFKAAKNKNF